MKKEKITALICDQCGGKIKNKVCIQCDTSYLVEEIAKASATTNSTKKTIDPNLPSEVLEFYAKLDRLAEKKDIRGIENILYEFYINFQKQKAKALANGEIKVSKTMVVATSAVGENKWLAYAEGVLFKRGFNISGIHNILAKKGYLKSLNQKSLSWDSVKIKKIIFDNMIV